MWQKYGRHDDAEWSHLVRMAWDNVAQSVLMTPCGCCYAVEIVKVFVCFVRAAQFSGFDVT
jgi:hypothetical protein